MVGTIHRAKSYFGRSFTGTLAASDFGSDGVSAAGGGGADVGTTGGAGEDTVSGVGVGGVSGWKLYRNFEGSFGMGNALEATGRDVKLPKVDVEEVLAEVDSIEISVSTRSNSDGLVFLLARSSSSSSWFWWPFVIAGCPFVFADGGGRERLLPYKPLVSTHRLISKQLLTLGTVASMIACAVRGGSGDFFTSSIALLAGGGGLAVIRFRLGLPGRAGLADWYGLLMSMFLDGVASLISSAMRLAAFVCF